MQVFPDRAVAEGLKTGRWFTRLLGRVLPRLLRPRRTLVILPDPVQVWWHMGRKGTAPAMQVVADWTVTNVHSEATSVRAAYLARPHTSGRHLTRELDSQYSTEGWPIPPGATTTVHTSFGIYPPVCQEREDFVADMVLVDQFGNKHKVRKVRFPSDAVRYGAVPRPEEEKLSAITDLLEKDVASILKAEIRSYLPGKRVAGQFGTVCLEVAGKTQRGFGTECFVVGAPRPVSVYTGPDEPQVTSVHAAALLKLHHNQTEPDRERVVQALLGRMVKGTEYECVGYLALLVLHRIGRIQVALLAARRYLQGGHEMGFQNVMHLLDELIKYEHRDFSDDLLNWIEGYVEGLTEHTFRIQDRIHDIRVLRINAAADQPDKSES